MKRMKMEDDSNSIGNKALTAMLEGLAGEDAEMQAQTEKDEEVQSLLQDMAQSPIISDDTLWDGKSQFPNLRSTFSTLCGAVLYLLVFTLAFPPPW